MYIRRLTPADAVAFQALRLAGLLEAPYAFGSSYQEEKASPTSTIENNLKEQDDRGVLGAFESSTLVGLIGLGRENYTKLSHKAFIWGMYVTPEARRKGVGRALLLEALSFARSVPGIRQVSLCVNASSVNVIRLYEAVGFKSFGREPGAMLIEGVLHDEIHMYIRLSDG